MFATASAQQYADLPSLRIAGQIGGPTIAAAVDGNTILAGSGYGLTVYDDSDPGVLRELGSMTFGDFVRGIAVAGNRAYVAAGSSGLHVVDLTDRTRPSIIGSWDSPGSAEGVAVADTTAYLADGSFGLRVIDVSIAASPTPLGSAFDDSFAFDIAISGKTAMVAGGSAGLLLADVSAPRIPVELTTLDTPGFARAVAVAGTRAVIADQWEGVRVIDVADPSHPIEVGSLATESWAFDVAIVESTAFVATGSAGLTAIDVASPADPRIVGALAVANGDAVAIATRDGRAFLGAGRAGFLVVDITNRASPLTLHAVAALGDGVGVTMALPYALVASGAGFAIIDASTPSRPQKIGFPSVGSSEFGTYIAAASGYAYLGASGKLVTFDIRDALHPVETSRVSIEAAAFRSMALRDDLLLAATEWDLAVFDISQKATPVLRSRVPMYTGPGTFQAIGVATTGRYAFVAQDKAGMTVVDLANPASPIVIAHYGPDPRFGVASIAASTAYAYVPRCNQLEIVGIADPSNPQLVANLAIPGCPYRATLNGDTLYLASGTDGVLEIDVSNVLRPTILSRTIPPGFATEVAVSDSVVGVAVLKLGLFLLEKRGAPGADGLPGDRPSAILHTAALPEGASSQRPQLPSFQQATVKRLIAVSSASDRGPGTLRDAIASAAEADVITFDPAVFPASSPVVIQLLSPLGCVQRFVTIDGRGAGVVLDGTKLSGDQIQNGLSLCSHGAAVKGLQIINFPGSGIAIGGSENTIDGNLVSGNRDSGIDIGGNARRNRIVGNLVGPAPQGFALRYQQAHGVFFARSAENTVGGASDADRNVIGGNRIDVGFIVASHNTLVGNYIGTDVTGSTLAANLLASSSEIGVNLEGGSHDNRITDNVIASGQAISIADSGSHYNVIARNRIGVGPDGRRIAGTTSSLGTGVGIGEIYNLVANNVIGGLRSSAIVLMAPADVFIVENLVGTDPAGTVPIPNATFEGAILLRGARRAFIEKNIVSGNHVAGIELRGPNNEQNFIAGNGIGAGRFGSPLGNGAEGIRVSASRQNYIQRNTITANASGILSTEGSRNRIRRNSIFANASAGILDLTVQPSAPPAIMLVTLDSVSGVTCANCVVELFSDEGGQGRWFEGETVAEADGSFTMRKFAGSLRGPRVSGTATDTSGATSGFSEAVQTPPLPPRRRPVRR